MSQQQVIRELVDLVLDGADLQLTVDTYRLEDNLETGEVKLECALHDARTGEQQTIVGIGVGIIDAMFQSLIRVYSKTFPSLTTIKLMDFAVNTDIASGKNARTDSTATVSLRIANSAGREFLFDNASPSLTRSSVQAVLQAALFFINSESAFIAVYKALEHARREGRADSIVRYTGQLTTLVEATSYSEVIEQMKRESSLMP